eukprot:381503-Rhodomonas_salina.1
MYLSFSWGLRCYGGSLKGKPEVEKSDRQVDNRCGGASPDGGPGRLVIEPVGIRPESLSGAGSGKRRARRSGGSLRTGGEVSGAGARHVTWETVEAEENSQESRS